MPQAPSKLSPIDPRHIHSHVRFVCGWLADHGHSGWIVGGAVRDLLLGNTPKDFDVVTSAHPEEVRRLFRNARLIGRRFRLALLNFGPMQVEVATFRGPTAGRAPGRGSQRIVRDNDYGTPEQDAFRRDFTANALAYDPVTETLYDFVGAMEDVRNRRLATIKPPDESMAEDPVRMLRALRFKVRLDFTLDPELEQAIRRNAGNLLAAGRHRLNDELQRFCTGGHAAATFTEFSRHGLLLPLLGMEGLESYFSELAPRKPLPLLRPYLGALDRWVRGGKGRGAAAVSPTVPPTVALLGLLTALASPELQHWLGGAQLKGKASSGWAAALPKFLNDWGLLQGQVRPGAEIWLALRALLSCQDKPRQLQRLLDKPLRGLREACLLAALLERTLEVDPELLELALARMEQLPDLPILDHARPANRPPGAQVEGRGHAELPPPRPRRRRSPGRERRPGPPPRR